MGVLAIINAQEAPGKVVPFTEEDRLILSYFADKAGAAIERARLTREIILRMIRMCELRDPRRPAPHTNRVGAYSAEIYRRWARNRACLKRRSTITRTCCALPRCSMTWERLPFPT